MMRADSPNVTTAIRVASPLAIVVAFYLFFAGHNQPGGGFAAGLVLGAIVALRSMAGLPRTFDATVWFAIGGLLVGAVAVAPLLFGEPVLDQVIVDAKLPILGKVKSGSAAVFDLGVVAVVVGLFVAVFDGLGAEDLAPEVVDESTESEDAA